MRRKKQYAHVCPLTVCLSRPVGLSQEVRVWCESLPQDAWARLEVRDGDKGPLMVDIVKRRVIAKIDRKLGPEETLLVIRWVGTTISHFR